MNDLIVSLLQERIDEYSNMAKDKYSLFQYYDKSKYIRHELCFSLKQRSKYKRALKEYEKLLHNLEVEKYRKAIGYYRRCPDKYVEDMLGIKLYPYQKLMLKYFDKTI